MIYRCAFSPVACLAVLIGGVLMADTARSEDALAAFMRAKLSHSAKVLEGLTSEDYELIAKHSQAMSLLCVDETWMVRQTPEYRQRSNEFRRSVDAITEAARKKNVEGATLAYVHATMQCASCHKYLRQTPAEK